MRGQDCDAKAAQQDHLWNAAQPSRPERAGGSDPPLAQWGVQQHGPAGCTARFGSTTKVLAGAFRQSTVESHSGMRRIWADASAIMDFMNGCPCP